MLAQNSWKNTDEAKHKGGWRPKTTSVKQETRNENPKTMILIVYNLIICL